jgi:hypothetical protein
MDKCNELYGSALGKDVDEGRVSLNKAILIGTKFE